MRSALLMLLPLSIALCALSFEVSAQTAQVGADRNARRVDKLRLDYLHYRPAKWETERVTESESQHPNQGGLLYAYFTNVSDEPVQLKFWRYNGEDESYWRLNHFIAWDRAWTQHLAPGAMGVFEINGVTADFAEGKPYEFAWVGDAWRPVMSASGELKQDPVRISYIRVAENMQDIEVHVRYTGNAPVAFDSLAFHGLGTESVDWRGAQLAAPGNAIARARLAAPLAPSTLLIAQLGVREDGELRTVMAHRRAFPDYFPIGVWSNDEDTWETLHRMHIDTMVAGGKRSNRFFSEIAPRYDFRAMTHTGVHTNVDVLRELGEEPAVACWMLQDEPDWSVPPNVMLHTDTHVRMINSTKPTFITLCRNTQFFEYAPIPDIACQDHYSVTAPSSSIWPKFYGTRLEETAWYTRDLKEAAEPKPIWIWTQGIADWSERPKRPVPTPNELAAQLVLNLGRGAKGILWFNHSSKMAAQWPDAVEAMTGWGRVMKLLREEFLASEPAQLRVQAPEHLDAIPLLSWNGMILCLTNTDYEIHPEAYPFVKKEAVEMTLELPAWLEAAAALRIGPDGPVSAQLNRDGNAATLHAGDVEACAIYYIAAPAALDALQARWPEIIAIEQ